MEASGPVSSRFCPFWLLFDVLPTQSNTVLAVFVPLGDDRHLLPSPVANGRKAKTKIITCFDRSPGGLKERTPVL